ncbi:MAG TPA: cupredoxin domain-containing protein [Solirubrobacteraceae bacterium]|nr:cupredoxin domain-containing protein [Solirubrobacteraceae bacterium]
MSNSLQHILNRVLVVLGVTLVLATGIVLVAHDGSTGAAEANRSAGAATATDKVPIKDFLYDPDGITVAAGTKITFTNEDSAPHTATSGPSPSPDGVFDTDILQKGQSKSITVTKAGTYAYYCVLHPFMKGTVIVT